MTPQEAAIKLRNEWIPLAKFQIDMEIDKGKKFSDRMFSAQKRAAKECAIKAQKKILCTLQNIDKGLGLSEKLESETGMLIHESIERESAILKALEEL